MLNADGKYEFTSLDSYEKTNDMQADLYQIIKLELGNFVEDKYEEMLDEFSTSTSLAQQNYYDNYSQVLRRTKQALKDKRITSLQNYITTKRNDIKDGLMSPKDTKQLSATIDALEKANRYILQLVYNISEEVKEKALRKTDNTEDLITAYYDKRISKKYSNLQEFIESCYNEISKAIELLYGGAHYGKKY